MTSLPLPVAGRGRAKERSAGEGFRSEARPRREASDLSIDKRNKPLRPLRVSDVRLAQRAAQDRFFE